MFRTNLEIWLTESERTFGKRYCPCFEPAGTPEPNQQLLCPCPHADVEIERNGTCRCVLFGRRGLTDAMNQVKAAEFRGEAATIEKEGDG